MLSAHPELLPCDPPPWATRIISHLRPGGESNALRRQWRVNARIRPRPLVWAGYPVGGEGRAGTAAPFEPVLPDQPPRIGPADRAVPEMEAPGATPSTADSDHGHHRR